MLNNLTSSIDMLRFTDFSVVWKAESQICSVQSVYASVQLYFRSSWLLWPRPPAGGTVSPDSSLKLLPAFLCLTAPVSWPALKMIVNIVLFFLLSLMKPPSGFFSLDECTITQSKKQWAVRIHIPLGFTMELTYDMPMTIYWECNPIFYITKLFANRFII